MIVVSKLNKPRKLKQVIHKDLRGSLTEIFLRKKIKFNFCKCITVTSKKNVIRGLHFQKKFAQHKIIFVLKGIINDFVVDIRKNSKTFGKVYKFMLLVFTLFFSLFISLTVKGWWQDIYAYYHQTSFNIQDPILGQDLSFYFFVLPLIKHFQGLFVFLMVLTIGICGWIYFSKKLLVFMFSKATPKHY